MKVAAYLALLMVAAVCAGGCKREHRVFDPGSPQTQVANASALNEIHAGAQWSPGPPSSPSRVRYDDNAYAVSEGKRLFESYNCVGCHQHGGGGIGPALMDAQWIYGSHPEQIYETIVRGRPNGMPSFSGKIPDYQVWELVAYVRSMSGQLREDVAPGRSDEMPVIKSEQARPKEHPSDEHQQKPPEGQP
ncbi:c-type cytochrome [Occallatibacter riparius]|uniref:C-type cytochrome n=1 Tax=Occallatibacter riparius TaxID=1002689 RepID=A0A9J7BND9_9BACT|nr:c-type cytochrome [Occallatibacter riparius]UWZ84135.1 c-type cytochrome [Occallatibacter riparius]